MHETSNFFLLTILISFIDVFSYMFDLSDPVLQKHEARLLPIIYFFIFYLNFFIIHLTVFLYFLEKNTTWLSECCFNTARKIILMEKY